MRALCVKRGWAMIIEKRADDEVLVLQTFGIQINIAGLIDHIKTMGSGLPILINSTVWEMGGQTTGPDKILACGAR